MPELVGLSNGWVNAEAGVPEARAWVRELPTLLSRRAGSDTARLRRMHTSFGSMYLAGFLATRDTSTLANFLARVDTIGSSTWHVADAQLALARRDTARARMRVARHYEKPEGGELTGEQGMVRVYAWGDLLARLGDARAAIGAFAKLDTNPQRAQHPGLIVRSYAERGALHQQLGEREKAIEFYEKFIAAWQHADPNLQREVDRAKQAVQAVKTGGRPVTPGR
jgi:tetratricopeptide (TPR) repeat protein